MGWVRDATASEPSLLSMKSFIFEKGLGHGMILNQAPRALPAF